MVDTHVAYIQLRPFISQAEFISTGACQSGSIRLVMNVFLDLNLLYDSLQCSWWYDATSILSGTLTTRRFCVFGRFDHRLMPTTL